VSNWRPSFLAATIVLSGGGFVGAVTADRADTNARTASQALSSPRTGRAAEEPAGKGQSNGQSTSPGTATTPPGTKTTPPGIKITPPADPRAPDTLSELNSGGQVEEGFADFGTQKIAGERYEGVSMNVSPYDSYGTPELPIKTDGRYKKLRGLVGIDGDTMCPRNDANVWITDDQGHYLWGPERVSFNFPKRFNIKIKRPPRVNLVQRSAVPNGDRCDDNDEADVAWGQVEFVK